jgi:hypothetical protein
LIISEKANTIGTYAFYSINKATKKKTLITKKRNTITNTCLNTSALVFIGTFPVDNIVRYCALGTDNTTPTTSDPTLGTEVHRTYYVARDNPSNGVVTIDFYVTDSDYSGAIEEVGIFGGNSAGASVDSGVLLSHVLWSYTKSASEELLIQYSITFSQ